MGLCLWELILLVIILKIMLSTQTSYCDEYNINRSDWGDINSAFKLNFFVLLLVIYLVRDILTSR